MNKITPQKESPNYGTFLLLYWDHQKERIWSQMMERFEIRYVGGHVEVYDPSGAFCFSADTKSEAESELQELQAA